MEDVNFSAIGDKTAIDGFVCPLSGLYLCKMLCMITTWIILLPLLLIFGRFITPREFAELATGVETGCQEICE